MMRTAYFAAGCFWGVEQKFSVLPGVVQTAVGYMGGDGQEPSYEQVCSGETGHAETVELLFDPQKISFDQLLERFWSMHNPRSLNRQGGDIGSQYRSAIFPLDDDQRQRAELSREQLATSSTDEDPIVTEITPATTFWRAEEYHQQYLAKRGQ